MKIPESFQGLMKEETKAFAFLATIMDDGTPQVTPVWFDWDGEAILINSVVGRTKDRNMRKRGNVALVIMDLRQPYRYLQVRGQVVEITTDGAVDHINRLSMKYQGKLYYSSGAKPEKRVIYRVKPEHIHANG